MVVVERAASVAVAVAVAVVVVVMAVVVVVMMMETDAGFRVGYEWLWRAGAFVKPRQTRALRFKARPPGTRLHRSQYRAQPSVLAGRDVGSGRPRTKHGAAWPPPRTMAERYGQVRGQANRPPGTANIGWLQSAWIF